jgi:hypothetical protein
MQHQNIINNALIMFQTNLALTYLVFIFVWMKLLDTEIGPFRSNLIGKAIWLCSNYILSGMNVPETLKIKSKQGQRK